MGLLPPNSVIVSSAFWFRFEVPLWEGQEGKRKNRILTGLAGLADRTRCHIERANRRQETLKSELAHYVIVAKLETPLLAD